MVNKDVRIDVLSYSHLRVTTYANVAISTILTEREIDVISSSGLEHCYFPFFLFLAILDM